MRWIQENTKHDEVTDDYSTDSTIVYWDSAAPKSCKKRKHSLRRKNLPSAKPSNPQAKVSFNFKVSVHGIQCRTCKYSYKCKISGCGKRFSNTHDWNSHHRACHASVFCCGKCFKVYPSPSLYRDHLYAHCENQYKCRQYNCTFPFLSGVKNHRRVHMSQCLFKCFAGGCKSSFKHPQDLHRHIAKHIGKCFTCDKCGHSTYQARLLQRHQVVHQSKQKHKCSLCTFKSKYRWSLD